MSKAQFMAENMQPGEIYAGLILGKNGEPDYHLFLRQETPETTLSWPAAVEWAQSIGFELPNRREQSLLFANCKEHFEAAWYWSSAQTARYDAYAWVQHFDLGDQYGFHKSDEFRARAVRRVLIIE